MYNMLARISDHCKMIDRWSYPEEENVQFEGAWELYARDFDPTLNQSFMVCNDAPKFDVLIFPRRMHRRPGSRQKVSFLLN